jgi:hypothetical protein
MESYVEKVEMPDIQNFINNSVEGSFLLPLISVDPAFSIKKVFSLLKMPILNKLRGKYFPDAYYMLERINRLISNCIIDEDFWDNFYRSDTSGFPDLFQLLFVISTEWGEDRSYTVNEFINREFIGEIRNFYGFDLLAMKIAMLKFRRLDEVVRIVRLLSKKYWDNDYADYVAINILASFSKRIEKPSAKKILKSEKVYDMETEAQTVFIFQHSSILFWMSEWFGGRNNDKKFLKYFSLYYSYYAKSKYLETSPKAAFTQPPASIFDMGHACKLGIIPELEIKKELLTRIGAEESLRQASAIISDFISPTLLDHLKEYGHDFSILKKITKEVCNYILITELNRGDSPTPVSHLAVKIQCVEGSHLFISILKLFGDEPFERLDYYNGTSYSKRQVLSKLLRTSRPARIDTPVGLRRLVTEGKIELERLIEAAMYSPHWIEFIGECIEWNFFLSSVCFFYAHIGVYVDDRMNVMVARFSSLDLKKLRSGAFDVSWYKDVVEVIGYKRFKIMLKAAGCISTTGGQDRLRKYVSAARGKEDQEELLSEIIHSRNKDLLGAYCLIPFPRNAKKYMVERYNYVMKFEKESRNFSYARMESEKQAALIGLINLTQSARHHPTRFVWNMEALLYNKIEHYFKPKVINGVHVSIKINELGDPEINLVRPKRGTLLHIPHKIRKDNYVKTLRETVKQIKSYKFNSLDMLEEAMVESVTFELREWQKWSKHPTIGRHIKNIIVSTFAEETGFVRPEGLVNMKGVLYPVDYVEKIFIIHPINLAQRKELEAYRKYLAENNITQPIKQVDRPFFGFRNVPALKSEIPVDFPWIPDGNRKSFRVFPNAGLVATITAGRLEFSDRRTFRPIKSSSVPEPIFSEVMCDLSEFNLYLLHQ